MTVGNWTDFNNAYSQGEQGNPDNSFLGKVADHAKTVRDYEADETTYQTTILAQFEKYRKISPEMALMYFFYYLSCSLDTNNHANMLGLFDDQVKGWGQSMAVNAYAGKLNSLLTDLTDDSVDTSQVPVGQQVTIAKQAVGLLIDAFNSDDVKSALDPSEIDTIQAQLKTIQDTLNNDFTEGKDDPKKLSSFDEMKTLLGQPGNVKGSADAAKSLTDALQIVTSSIQNTNAAFNEKVGQVTGTEKSLQSFISSLMKSFIDACNQTIQNSLRN